MTRRRQILAFAGAALAAPAFVRHARADAPPRFGLGVASGHPRPNGVVLWTRLLGEDLPARVEVAWEVAHDERFERIAARGTASAEADWAHSVHAEPHGLEPGRWYFYRFHARGQTSPVGRTRTAPPAHVAAPLAFAIASCQRWDHGHYAAWRDVAAADGLDLVLFLGDYIYEYPSPPGRVRHHEGGYVLTLHDYRARYAQYKSDSALQAAHAAAPWLTTWDDHEVDNDYAGDQGQDLQPGFRAQREAAYRAYWEHMPLPVAMRPQGGGLRLHTRMDWGALARVHLLDARQYRDPQACPRAGRGGSNTVTAAACEALADPQRSLLGAEQERWLDEGWDTQRRWNLVGQQTLMARFSRSDPATGGTYWTDGWDGYAPARQRLLEGIAQRRLGGAVVLGGDVHANIVADLRSDFDDERSPVIASEFCGTSITSQSNAQGRLDRTLGFNPHIRYARADQRGYVRFRLDAQRLHAELRVVGDVLDPHSPVHTAARFAVEHGRPGAVAA